MKFSVPGIQSPSRYFHNIRKENGAWELKYTVSSVHVLLLFLYSKFTTKTIYFSVSYFIWCALWMMQTSWTEKKNYYILLNDTEHFRVLGVGWCIKDTVYIEERKFRTLFWAKIPHKKAIFTPAYISRTMCDNLLLLVTFFLSYSNWVGWGDSFLIFLFFVK